jgi:hypothetical protein
MQMMKCELLSCERHRGGLNTYFRVKKANLKRPHTILFLLCVILDKVKVWKQRKDECLLGDEGREGVQRSF